MRKVRLAGLGFVDTLLTSQGTGFFSHQELSCSGTIVVLLPYIENSLHLLGACKIFNIV